MALDFTLGSAHRLLKNGYFYLLCLMLVGSASSLAPLNSVHSGIQSEIAPNLLVIVEPSNGRLHLIDPDKSSLVRTYSASIDTGTVGAANGRVYFVSMNSGLTSLDLSDGKQKVLHEVKNLLIYKVPGPGALAVSPGGTLGITAHHNWSQGDVALTGSFWLSLFNLKTGELISKIPPQPEFMKLSPDAGCFNSKLMITEDDRWLYQLCGGWIDYKYASHDPILRILDLIKGQVVGRLKLPNRVASVLSPDERRLYVLTKDSQLLVVDPQKPAVIETHELRDGSRPLPLTSQVQILIGPGADRIFIREGNDLARLYEIDTGSWAVKARSSFTDGLEDIMLSQDGRRLYLLMLHRLVVLDAENLSEVEDLELPIRSRDEKRRFLLSTR